MINTILMLFDQGITILKVGLFICCCFCCLGGDGPKRALLEDVCQQCKLQDRVQFLGKLAHENVRDVS